MLAQVLAQAGAEAPRAGFAWCSRRPRPLWRRPRSPSRSSRRDLRLASHYRQTLDQANGKEFESYALRGAGDAHVGTVFSYEGSPSWVHIDVDPAHRTGLTAAELVTDDGSQVPLRWFHLDPQGGSGGSIPVDPNARLRPAAVGRSGHSDLDRQVQVAPADEEEWVGIPTRSGMRASASTD